MSIQDLSIGWVITCRCNNKCGSCYAKSDVAEMSESEENIVIDKIHEAGIKYVTICGGEPLLEPDRAIRIIEKLKKKPEVRITVSTNGINLVEYANKILPLVDKISLPLDGFDGESNRINGRNKNDFDVVDNIFEFLHESEPKFNIDVTTVMTAKNADIKHFKQMADYLSDKRIGKWTVFQFIPQERGLVNEEEFYLGEDSFKKIEDNLREYVENKYDMKIDFLSMWDRSCANFLIQPNGDATSQKEARQRKRYELEDGTKRSEIKFFRFEKSFGNVINDDLEILANRFLALDYDGNVRRHAIRKKLSYGEQVSNIKEEKNANEEFKNIYEKMWRDGLY